MRVYETKSGVRLHRRTPDFARSHWLPIESWPQQAIHQAGRSAREGRRCRLQAIAESAQVSRGCRPFRSVTGPHWKTVWCLPHDNPSSPASARSDHASATACRSPRTTIPAPLISPRFCGEVVSFATKCSYCAGDHHRAHPSRRETGRLTTPGPAGRSGRVYYGQGDDTAGVPRWRDGGEN